MSQDTMYDREQIPMVRFAGAGGAWGMVHAVWATGTIADGSLHGMETYCGRECKGNGRTDGNYREELPGAGVECAHCRRSIAIERRGRIERRAAFEIGVFLGSIDLDSACAAYPTDERDDLRAAVVARIDAIVREGQP